MSLPAPCLETFPAGQPRNVHMPVRNSLLLLAMLPACVTTAPEEEALKDTQASAAAPVQQNADWARGYVSDLEQRLHANADLKVINDLEDAVAEVEASVVRPWAAGWRAGDNSALASMRRGMRGAPAQ